MANTVMTRARRDRWTEPRLPWATALIALAAVLRVAAVLAPDHARPLLIGAAACWSVAMLLLTALLAPLAGRGRNSPA